MFILDRFQKSAAYPDLAAGVIEQLVIDMAVVELCRQKFYFCSQIIELMAEVNKLPDT